MSRHYQFESLLSVTGANADKRIPIKPSETNKYILKLYDELLSLTGDSSIDIGNTKHDVLINRIAIELLENKGKSLVISESDNIETQIIINGINNLLNNYEQTISTKISADPASQNSRTTHLSARQLPQIISSRISAAISGIISSIISAIISINI